MNDHLLNNELQDLYNTTKIIRRPLSGIVSGYHDLPYILISPHDENASHSIEINGKISVSPKFIISPGMINESFGDIFDPETFDKQIEGRLFSFGYANKRNLKIQNESFRIDNFEEGPEDHCNRVNDQLMQEENTKSGLIFCPKFQFYPVSIDRFISEILDREFRV
jgi:hypothetical protein